MWLWATGLKNAADVEDIHSKSGCRRCPDSADIFDFLQKNCLRMQKLSILEYAFLCILWIFMHYYAIFVTIFYHKGWLPRAKLRPLVKIRLARPIRGQDFRWSFFLFGPVWFTAMNYAFMALKWWLLLSIQFMNNTWTLLYVHFHWKKTECFRVAKTQNEWSFKAKNVTVGAEEQ